MAVRPPKKTARQLRIDKFARVSTVALHDKRLTPRDKLVYVALCDFMDLTGRCWPSVRAIGEITGQGRTTIFAALQTLESLGYIERIQRHATSNLYRVNELPLTDFIRPSDDMNSSDSDQHQSESELTQESTSVYVVFDEETGALRNSTDPRTESGQKEDKEIELIKELWKKALPDSPLGMRNETQNRAFVYFCRKEGITPRLVNDIISLVLQSSFLQGMNERHWKPSLFWCLKNREKILQGRYTNYKNTAGNIELRF